MLCEKLNSNQNSFTVNINTCLFSICFTRFNTLFFFQFNILTSVSLIWRLIFILVFIAHCSLNQFTQLIAISFNFFRAKFTSTEFASQKEFDFCINASSCHYSFLLSDFWIYLTSFSTQFISSLNTQ